MAPTAAPEPTTERSPRARAPRDLDADRALGALAGLAVGDALGTTLEFTSPAVPALPALMAGPHVAVTGGGPFGLAPGQVTDDTQMATALARSLAAEGGFRADAVAAAYVAWSRHAFDIGGQTRAALARVAAGTAPLEAGRAVWAADPQRRPAGNGSLMRTAPLAVFYARDRDRLREVSLAESAITHFDPRCRLACAAFNAALAEALGSPGADAEAMALAAERELPLAASALASASPASDSAAIAAAARDLALDLAAARAADPSLMGPELHLHRTAGFVRVAFRLAFWHLHHTPSWPVALVDVANRGGDADTNAAIAGALLGARDGASAIPAAWRALVEGALAGQRGPWAETYHPRALYALLAP